MNYSLSINTYVTDKVAELRTDSSTEQKLSDIKSVLESYDPIENVGDWQIDIEASENSAGEYVEWENYFINFESELSIYDHTETDTESKKDVPVQSDNLLVYFTQKGGIFHEIAPILLPENSEDYLGVNLYCEDNHFDLDIELEHDTFHW